MDKEDMYLTTEEDSSYRLTTREAFLMVTIGGTAMLMGALSNPTIGE
ncbi:hypothetical protein HY857_02280 [Candidatus Saccharibacteria bacterium]|nr:hypothetical protein [Candidatus Saccharibacteria bacterium]